MRAGRSRRLQWGRGGILFAAAGVLCAQTPPDAIHALEQVRDSVVRWIKYLPDYTCVQTVNRSYFRRAGGSYPFPSCAQMHAEQEAHAYRLDLYLTDRLRLDVMVSGGQEIGSWAGASQFDAKSIFDLVGKGPFGTGALGMFLADIFVGGGALFAYKGEAPEGDGTLYAYRFQVPIDASHCTMKAGSGWQTIAYEGEVAIDPRSFQIRHLLAHASHLPPETDTCAVDNSVDYATLRMSTGEFLLPQQSKLHLLNSDGNESDTTTTYGSCREYQSESTIFFGHDPAATSVKNMVGAKPVVLPAGLPIELELVSPIDTDVAAAGDVAIEKVRNPVRAKGSKEVLVPPGATVRGRIVQMKHWMLPPVRFEITIQLESWETAGVTTRLYAKPARDEMAADRPASIAGAQINLPPAGQSPRVGTFIFKTKSKRYVVPLGLESKWITISAPSEKP